MLQTHQRHDSPVEDAAAAAALAATVAAALAPAAADAAAPRPLALAAAEAALAADEVASAADDDTMPLASEETMVPAGWPEMVLAAFTAAAAALSVADETFPCIERCNDDRRLRTPAELSRSFSLVPDRWAWQMP